MIDDLIRDLWKNSNVLWVHEHNVELGKRKRNRQLILYRTVIFFFQVLDHLQSFPLDDDVSEGDVEAPETEPVFIHPSKPRDLPILLVNIEFELDEVDVIAIVFNLLLMLALRASINFDGMFLNQLRVPSVLCKSPFQGVFTYKLVKCLVTNSYN